jgi:hypothetical protein
MACADSGRLVLAGVLLLTAFAGSASRSVTVAPEKVVREFTLSTGGSCDFDYCVLTNEWELPVTTPTGESEIDLLVSVSFSYRVSEGDYGLAKAGIVLEGEARSTR